MDRFTLKPFTTKPILVIGDCINDTYMHGDASRLSPEAPVPVIALRCMESRLGGAANVAANIVALGGTVELVGIIGNDPDGVYFTDAAVRNGIPVRNIVRSPTRMTTTKIRIMANGQQVARVDIEDTDILSELDEQKVIHRIASCLATEDIAAIVISDYAKGLISQDVYAAIRDLSSQHRIPVFNDPKNPELPSAHFKVVTPNKHEAEKLSGVTISDDDTLLLAATRVMQKTGAEFVLITRGNEGMSLYCRTAMDRCMHMAHIPTVAKTVFDVSGAGDTVIATLALAYASDYGIVAAAKIANTAAGVVVGKPGTATVNFDELERAMNETTGSI